jgi:hypothetical protein
MKTIFFLFKIIYIYIDVGGGQNHLEWSKLRTKNLVVAVARGQLNWCDSSILKWLMGWFRLLHLNFLF